MKRQFSIYGALAAFILFLGVLTGCEADDTPGGSSSGKVVPVIISLQMDEVDQLTKAVNENAINTLDVYIYNDNGTTVEKHLTKDDFGDDLRAETTLSEGPKTIYVIANAGNPYGESAPTNNTAVDAIGQWLGADATAIPMSSQLNTTWTVSKDVKEYTVEINRMVAKMNVKIVDERADQTNAVGNITIENLLLAQTPLYRSEYGVVASPGEGNDWNGVGMNDGEYFYLHENSGTFPISVTVGTASRTGNLEANIPRNHIFPLVIHLTDYSLDIKVEYQLAAIGTLPVTKELNTYSFELPEGCTYKVTVTPKKNMTGGWATDAKWTWTVPTDFGSGNLKVNPINGVTPSWPENAVIDGTDDAFFFSGSVVSVPTEENYEIPIILKDGEVTMNFDLVIKTRPLKDGDSTRSYSVSAETEAVHIDL